MESSEAKILAEDSKEVPSKEKLKLIDKSESIDLAKLSIIYDDLSRRLKTLQTAERYAQTLPLDLKERVENKDHSAVFSEFAFFFAGVPSSIRKEAEYSTIKALEIVDGLVSNYASSEWISVEDLEMVANFIRFLAKLQPRSKRQIRQFFECALEGDMTAAMLTNKGTKAEVKFNFEDE